MKTIATIIAIIGLTLYAPLELTRYIVVHPGLEFTFELYFMWALYVLGISLVAWRVGRVY